MKPIDTGTTVRFTLGPNSPLSAEEKEQLVRLAAMPDSEIDLSDIPASPADAVWTKPGAFIP
jgi:hypothetical protein